MGKKLVHEEWVEDYAKFICAESISLLKTVGSTKGQNTVKTLSRKFIGFFIETLVKEALYEYKDKNLSGSKAYLFSKTSLVELKQDLQDQIARGFEKAFEKYSGIRVEYYVTIQVVPEPKNKEVC